MSYNLKGKTVAILSTNGFEEIELTSPREALDKAGAETHIVAPEKGTIKSWDTDDWGSDFDVDVTLDEADEGNYDALVLPGGVLNPDQLRMNDKAVGFVKAFFSSGKPVAAICHGPQILIDADVLEERKLTSYPSLKNDLKNAGAHWENSEVVVDEALVTSRTPDDLPAFNDKMLEEIAEGIHEGQTA